MIVFASWNPLLAITTSSTRERTRGHLAGLAAEIRRKLKKNYCCLFFDREPMLTRLRLHLAAANVDVACDHARPSLILSSELKRLDESGTFDVERMIQSLSDALDRALSALLRS